MKRNSLSVAMLAALAVCGVVQNASIAQGGVLLPETTTAPMVRVVPNVVEYPAKKINRTDAAMPSPRGIRPITATGRIVHVEEVMTNGVASPSAIQPVAPLSMGMGGFVTPRPASLSAPSIVMPAK